MKPFADTRARRSTAFVLLLVWLFALASSVANACVLKTSEPNSSAATASQPATDLARAEWHGSSPDAGHDAADASSASCLKFCGDGTRTLPKAGTGVDHNDPGPAPLVTILWVASQHVLPTPRHATGPATPVLGPPLRLRYSRLAL